MNKIERRAPGKGAVIGSAMLICGITAFIVSKWHLSSPNNTLSPIRIDKPAGVSAPNAAGRSQGKPKAQSDLLDFAEARRLGRPGSEDSYLSNLQVLIGHSAKVYGTGRELLWLHFITGTQDALSADLALALLHQKFEGMQDVTKGITLEDHTTFGEMFIGRIVSRFRDAGRGDELYLLTQNRASSANPYILASLFEAEGESYMRPRQLEIPELETRNKVKGILVEKWSRNDNMRALRYVLDPDWQSPDALAKVDRVLPPIWFSENAAEVSSMLNSAPSSAGRSALVRRMAGLIAKDDPVAAARWIESISYTR